MRNMHFIIILLLAFAASLVHAAAPAPALSYTAMKVQVARVPVQPGISFDDAVESLKLRANQHNLKLVGSSPLYKEIQALTGKPSRRMEIFSFCDGLVAQQMISADPLMISFMPCRISILEDERGKLWVISMIIDSAMLDALKPEIRKNAQRIMDAMKDSMLAASNGDL